MRWCGNSWIKKVELNTYRIDTQLYIRKAEYWHGLYIHYMYNTPLNVIRVLLVCIVLVVGISQDTATCSLGGTEEGV